MIASKVRTFVFFLQLLHYLSFIQSDSVMLLSEFTVTCNPDFFVCKTWVTYTKENDTSTYLINIDVEIIKGGLSSMNYNFKAFTNPIGKQNETKKLVDINTDICKFAKRRSRTNPLNIYLSGLVRKYGKIPRCPIMKLGHYYVHNLTTSGMVVPRFAQYILGEGDLTIKFRFAAKLGKQPVQTMNVTYIGGYRNIK